MMKSQQEKTSSASLTLDQLPRNMSRYTADSETGSDPQSSISQIVRCVDGSVRTQGFSADIQLLLEQHKNI